MTLFFMTSGCLNRETVRCSSLSIQRSIYLVSRRTGRWTPWHMITQIRRSCFVSGVRSAVAISRPPCPRYQ